MKTETILILAAVAGVYIVARRMAQAGALNTGAAVGAAVVDAGTGVVLGVGDAVGIPRTNEDKCQAAMRAGETFNASLYCPALTFIKYATGQTVIDTNNPHLPDYGTFDPGSGGNNW